MRLRETDRMSADDRGTDVRMESKSGISSGLDKKGVADEDHQSKEVRLGKVDKTQSQAAHPPILLDEIHGLIAGTRSAIRDSSSIKSIYRNHDFRVDYSAIADWSTRFLCTVYIEHLAVAALIATCLVLITATLSLNEIGRFGLALLPFSRIPESRWVLFGRVSSDQQMDNTSIAKQIRYLENAVEENDGKITKKIERAETGSHMDRQSLNRVLEMAENEEFDVLGVWKLDRLTRSDPWESVNYLYKLRERDVTVYADNHGYFDWDDPHDFEILAREVVFANEWYARIKENAEEGQLDHLKEGKYPFGDAPFGYTKDEDDILHLSETGEKVIPELFKKYIEEENRAAARRHVNKVFDLEGDDRLTDSQAQTVLSSPRCVGHMTLKEEVVTTRQELACVPKEVFNEAQDIAENRRSDSSTEGTDVVPRPINRAHRRFGSEFLTSLFDTLHTLCPECSSHLEETSTSTTVRGHVLRVYACDSCEYRGPLFTREQIDQLDSTIPLSCPMCQTIGELSRKKASSCHLDYKYSCKICHHSFHSSVSANKYQRAIDNQEAAFRWDPDGGRLDKNSHNKLEDISDTSSDNKFIWDTTISRY